MTPRSLGITACTVAALSLSACGGDGDKTPTGASAQTTKVEQIAPLPVDSGFDPRAIYKRIGPGVVTVISVFPERGSNVIGDDAQRGLGSGFVLNGEGEIATNAHVVTTGTRDNLRAAKEVYVAFADENRVLAEVVGYDPNSDVALLRVKPDGLTLRPLPLADSSTDLVVGSPVVAIGSPFGEPQSLSVGVLSALDRSIDSLTGFAISGALQTDAAINHGNSGGPLVDARGEVLGINSQIESTGGGGEGVGFAVPVETVRRSLEDLRRDGRVRYAFLGVSTTTVYPQLAQRFSLPVEHGAWVQEVTKNSPADRARLRAGSSSVLFQAQEFTPGGDVIVAIDGKDVADSDDVSGVIATHEPGETVTLTIRRAKKRMTVKVELGERPGATPQRR